MKQQNTPRAQAPTPWLYRGIMACLRPALRRLFGLEATRSGGDFQGPGLLLANHQGLQDFLLIAAALPQREITFVGSDRYFQKPLLAALFRKLGVIPKRQFQPDAGSIKNMLYRVAQGDLLGIFPAGQTSMSGVPDLLLPGIGRLCRKLNVPVYRALVHGSFLTLSRHSGLQYHRGRTQVELSLLLSPQDLAQMTDVQVEEAIAHGLFYDEYAWQQATGATYRGRNLARGYENLCWRCPRCGGEGTLYSQGNRLLCQHCQNTGIVQPSMAIVPATPQDVVLPNLRDWYQWQGDVLLEQIAQPGFCICHPAQVYTQDSRGLFALGGAGTVSLDEQGIAYRGTLKGEEFFYQVPHKLQPGMMGTTGSHFELLHPSLGPLRFYPKNGRFVSQIKQCQELLYLRQSAD